MTARMESSLRSSSLRGAVGRHPRHGRVARAARRVRDRPRRPRARRGPAELPQPAPGHPVRRPRGALGVRRPARGRRVPSRPAAHHPAVRRRPGDHPRRPRCQAGHPRRHQRRRRRQLPDDAGPPGRGRSRPPRRPADADQGAQRQHLSDRGPGVRALGVGRDPAERTNGAQRLHRHTRRPQFGISAPAQRLRTPLDATADDLSSSWR